MSDRLGDKSQCASLDLYAHHKIVNAMCIKPSDLLAGGGAKTMYGGVHNVSTHTHLTSGAKCPVQWRIQNFPKVGAPTLQEGGG